MKKKAKYIRPIDYCEMTGMDLTKSEEKNINVFLLEAHAKEVEILKMIKLFCEEYNIIDYKIHFTGSELFDNNTQFDFGKIIDSLNFPLTN